MRELSFDCVVIGGGAAGMAAALELEARGLSVAVAEREERLGGILTQCIHNGFGLIEFNEELTGPEFAERFEERIGGRRISVYCGCTVLDMLADEGEKVLSCVSAKEGALRLRSRAVVLAMGAGSATGATYAFRDRGRPAFSPLASRSAWSMWKATCRAGKSSSSARATSV